MAFDWREYLFLAQFLNGAGGRLTEEAAWRTAVSRAYYAAFCHVRDYAAVHLNFTPHGGPTDHDRLRDHLRTRREGELAQQLGRLRNWRNQCDYDSEVAELSRMAGAATTHAEGVVNRF